MQKILLTDRYIASLPNAAMGKRYVINDAKAIPLAVRVTERGVKSFIVVKRPAGSDTPSTVVIGRFPETALKAARAAVPGILAVLAQGTTVNRRWTGTPYRHSKGTPLSGVVWW
ncbi:hypothetical protein BH10PSE6_BH10PSE6_23860 [soil metagenome]